MTDRETIKNKLFDLGVEGNQYGDLIDYISNLEAEVMRLRKENEFHMMLDREKTKEDLKLYKENDNLTKLCIERYAEIKRLRSIADDLYAYIVSDADISLKIIEEQMDWRDEE
jgi:hypothetical protein